MDVPDMEAVMAAIETAAAGEAMAYDGVLPETLVILVEASAGQSDLYSGSSSRSERAAT